MTDLEKLNIDAARYRWLRENVKKFGEEVACVDADDEGFWQRYVTAQECDAAIDAELARDK